MPRSPGTSCTAVNGPFSIGPEVGVGLHARVAVVVVVDGAAATEVLVDAGAGEAVEPLDGGEEGRGVHAHLRRELLDGVGRDRDAAVAHRLAAGQHRGEHVPLAVAAIDDEPRHVRRGREVALEQVVAEVDVALGLVEVARARLVDDDAERVGALVEHEQGLRVGDRHGCAPPRVVHEGERAAGLRTGLDGRAEVALGRGAVAGDAVVLLSPFAVVGEAAGAEDDAASRTDADRAVGGCDDGAEDRAVGVLHELGERRVQQELGALLLHDQPETEHEAPAHADELTAREEAAECPEDELRAAEEARRRRPCAGEEPDVVGLHRHRIASPIRDVRCQSPSLRASIGTTSIARPTLPPGRSG